MAPGNSTRNLRGMGETLVASIVKPMSWFDSSLVMPAVHHVDPQASCHGPAFAALQKIVECQCLTPLPCQWPVDRRAERHQSVHAHARSARDLRCIRQ